MGENRDGENPNFFLLEYNRLVFLDCSYQFYGGFMRLLALFLILAVSLGFTQIRELEQFEEITHCVDSETLLILDIDDTLIVPAQMLGNGKWFEYRWDLHEAQGLTHREALEKTLAEWEAIRHLSQMRLVEPEIPNVVSSLQKQAVDLMGVTHQGLALATRTAAQLKELNIDLSLSTLVATDRCIEVDGHTVLFRKGILFTSGKSKGDALFTLFDEIGKTVTRIVAVDDKRVHLEDLEKKAELRGIEFLGFHYRAMERQDIFLPEIADYQFKHSTFSHILSDEEARALLEEVD